MEMISGITAGSLKPSAKITGTEEVALKRQSEEKTETQSRPLKPVRDEYLPEEEQDPSGRYWVDKDEGGKLKICFDDPNKSKLSDVEADKSDQDKVKQNERESGAKPEICCGSTDKVDREIEKLKKEQKELEQKLNSETDETKIKELENRLNEVERELRQKDNDTYRRQHTVFS